MIILNTETISKTVDLTEKKYLKLMYSGGNILQKLIKLFKYSKIYYL